MRVLQTLENPRHHGPIAAILVDRKRSWVLTGSAAGILALWDLRFGLNVRTWKAGASVSGPSSEGISITTLALHPTRGKGRWVVIAFQSRNTSGPGHDRPEGESTQVEIWDIERGVMVERYLSLQPITDDSSQHEQLPGQAGVGAASSEETSTPATAIAAMVRRRQAVDEDYARPSNTGSALPAPPSAETRALLLGVDLGGAPPRSDVVVDLGVEGASPLRRRGYMITGAEDRRVRIWDLNKVEHSVVLSGPPPENTEEHPTYSS
jgi:phosphoinositide-3-kinase regulatory subunit 4